LNEAVRNNDGIDELSVEEVLRKYGRFRILSAGKSGSGKSSLINRVFNVNDAKVSDYQPGEANIQSEITSQTNQLFVLHDSKGFEPANTDTFNIVREFVTSRSNKDLDLKDQLHVAWLCIQTPAYNARVLERGEEDFLTLARVYKVPVVVVFTQYDELVYEFVDSGHKENEAKEAAKNKFQEHVEILRRATQKLGIEMPQYINVSVKNNFDENIIPLVEMTRKIVEGQAWCMWAMAQQASRPLKVELCVKNSMTHYRRGVIYGAVPGGGDYLLRQCLFSIHKDIIACWNMQDINGVLNGEEFKHLMLYVVQDLQTQGQKERGSPVDIMKIHNFVALCTVAQAAVAPPVAILGLTFFFVSWMSSEVASNAPEAQRVLYGYTVDLILVMEELFKLTLRPTAAGSVTWLDLQEAFDAYQRTRSYSEVHQAVGDLVAEHGTIFRDVETIRRLLRHLLHKFTVM